MSEQVGISGVRCYTKMTMEEKQIGMMSAEEYKEIGYSDFEFWRKKLEDSLDAKDISRRIFATDKMLREISMKIDSLKKSKYGAKNAVFDKASQIVLDHVIYQELQASSHFDEYPKTKEEARESASFLVEVAAKILSLRVAGEDGFSIQNTGLIEAASTVLSFRHAPYYDDCETLVFDDPREYNDIPETGSTPATSIPATESAPATSALKKVSPYSRHNQPWTAEENSRLVRTVQEVIQEFGIIPHESRHANYRINWAKISDRYNDPVVERSWRSLQRHANELPEFKEVIATALAKEKAKRASKKNGYAFGKAFRR